MAPDPVALHPFTPEAWPSVRRIYEQGIESGDATFETEAPAWEEWDASHAPHSRIVATVADDVVGWAALSPVSERCVYDGVAEVSVYVDEGLHGRGIGGRLLAALITESEANGIWTLQAGVFPENEASIALHLRYGFRVVGVRERLGRIGNRWRDVTLVERRSPRL